MRRSASQVIRNLEMRVARLEKRARSRYATFFQLFDLAKGKSKRLRTLETGVLEKGGRAIVADLYDMVDLLTSAKARAKGGREITPNNFGKSDLKYIIVEDEHKNLERNGVIKVIAEHELEYKPQHRTYYFFYLYV